MSKTSLKYHFFVGRWDPFHSGHKYIIDSFVNNGRPVCIAVRDSPETYTAKERKEMVEAVYKDNLLVKVIIIPDIEGIVTGRQVGYYIMQVPEDISVISGTEVRLHKGAYMDVPEEVRNYILRLRERGRDV